MATHPRQTQCLNPEPASAQTAPTPQARVQPRPPTRAPRVVLQLERQAIPRLEQQVVLRLAQREARLPEQPAARQPARMRPAWRPEPTRLQPLPKPLLVGAPRTT